MSQFTLNLLVIGASFAVYIAIAFFARAKSTAEFYAANRGVHPVLNGMATGADWMSAASFISMAGLIAFTGYDNSTYLMGWTGGYVLLALLLAPYLRKFGKFTVPQFIGDRFYSNGARIIGVICLMPVFLLTIASGAVFGVTHASLYVMTASLTGGLCSFLIARYLIREKVSARIARDPRLSAIDRAVGEDGRRLVFFLRLSPVVPFVLTNYALGATRVKLPDYLLGTLGLAPIVISYAAFGKAAGATNEATGESALSWPVLAVGVLATVFLGWLIARIARRAIAEAEAEQLARAASQG